MEFTTFDYYIDQSLNGNYIAQTKRISSIPDKIERYLVYTSKATNEKVLDQNWLKMLYYFYASFGDLLNFSVSIENQCKFYDQETYKKAKKESVVIESFGQITKVIQGIIPFAEKFIDRNFQKSISKSIDTLDQWIKIGKKIQDSETTKLLKTKIHEKYKIKINFSSIDVAYDILEKSKSMRNKLIASRRIVAYYLTKPSALTDEQRKEIQKAFQNYLKKEKEYLKTFFDISMKYHN